MGTRLELEPWFDIVVTHDLRVTFTDDRLNAQIQLRRVHNDLDRGRSIAASEQAQKRGAGASASGLTPEKKIAGEVFVDAGAAPFDFDKTDQT